MIFLPLIAWGIIEYLRGKRLYPILIFFFFLTDGFQLIPTFLFDTGLGLNKSGDLAVIYLLSLFFVNVILYKREAIGWNDKVLKWLCVFLIYLGIIWIINIFIYKVPFVSIFKSNRSFFLLFAFFVFSKLDSQVIIEIKKKLFVVSIFLSILFIIQVFTSTRLLTGYVGGVMNLGNITMYRYYNLPLINYYFLFYSLFANPYHGTKKTFSQIVLVVSFLLPMHRGFIIGFLLLLLLGIFIAQRSSSRAFRNLLVFGFLLLPFSGLILDRFSGSDSLDVRSLISGEVELDNRVLIADNGTMFYRAAHLIERTLLISSKPVYQFFGLGFWTDDDNHAKDKFDLYVGSIQDEDYEHPLIFFTNDIAWSVFFMRLGFIGTIIYLIFYFYFLRFFYIKRKNPLGLVNSLVLLLFVLTSITSVEIVTIGSMTLSILDYCLLNKENISSSDIVEENEYMNGSHQTNTGII